MKYLSEKELMGITTTNEANERFKKIIKKYPILKELEKKLNYEQFANLYFLVDYLYSYQEMWEEAKEDLCEYGINSGLVVKTLEQKYFPKEKQ